MHLIQTRQEFTNLISDLSKHDVIAIDTEFLRDKTYYPQFCLLQIATQNKAYAVDALSEEVDFTLLKDLLINESVTKVFHSCKQDVEILCKAIGVMPNNIFDTQVAAAFCGISDMPSYDFLCRKLLNKNIDKTQRVTDWSMRPLRDNQIKYALNDVIYLIEIYKKLSANLEKDRKKSWALEYMKNFSNEDYFKLDADQVWQRLTMPQIPFKAKHAFKIIAIWREQKAIEYDIPRRKFLSDNDMINISLFLTGVNKNKPDNKIFAEYSDQIKNFLEEFSKNNNEGYLTKKIMNVKQRNDYKLLKNLLSLKAKESNIARHLVARNYDLSDLIFLKNFDENICTRGWRKEIYGNFAIQILQNK